MLKALETKLSPDRCFLTLSLQATFVASAFPCCCPCRPLWRGCASSHTPTDPGSGGRICGHLTPCCILESRTLCLFATPSCCALPVLPPWLLPALCCPPLAKARLHHGAGAVLTGLPSSHASLLIASGSSAPAGQPVTTQPPS